MPTVRSGPVIGLIVQIVLVEALAATVGLGGAAWLAGTTYGVVTCVALTLGLGRSGAAALGPANCVTLARAILVGGVATLTVEAWERPVPLPVLVGLVIGALVLDGVDGQVARRTGSVSALGARFDMEIDASLLMVLSIYVARSEGIWVLVMGLMRYAFLLAVWTLPWMRRTLPPRFWRKVVAATQGVALVVATGAVLPRPATTLVLLGALAMLFESFGRDVRWLWSRRLLQPEPAMRPGRHRADVVPRPRREAVLSGSHS